ncbi:MAG: 4a-hydroxytetrahydrobiopterin dehydratase [Sandaracinaceae bacterium]
MSSDAVTDALSRLSGWRHEDDKLKKSYRFGSFREAVAFLVRVAFEAEQRNHHPEVYNVYGTVDLALTSHDAGNKVTAMDVDLAAAIDELG